MNSGKGGTPDAIGLRLATTKLEVVVRSNPIHGEGEVERRLGTGDLGEATEVTSSRVAVSHRASERAALG